MLKTFQGEVIESKDSSFNNSNDELVVLHRICILTSEDRCKTFFFSNQEPDLFEQARAVQVGQQVRIEAEARPGKQDSVKWRASGLAPVDQIYEPV